MWIEVSFYRYSQRKLVEKTNQANLIEQAPSQHCSCTEILLTVICVSCKVIPSYFELVCHLGDLVTVMRLCRVETAVAILIKYTVKMILLLLQHHLWEEVLFLGWSRFQFVSFCWTILSYFAILFRQEGQLPLMVTNETLAIA